MSQHAISIPLSTPSSEMSGRAGVAPAVDVAPEPLDVERVGADHVRVADVLDHPRDDVRAEGRPVDLAEPLDRRRRWSA